MKTFNCACGKYSTFLFAFTILLAACKKDPPNSTTPPAPTSHWNAGGKTYTADPSTLTATRHLFLQFEDTLANDSASITLVFEDRVSAGQYLLMDGDDYLENGFANESQGTLSVYFRGRVFRYYGPEFSAFTVIDSVNMPWVKTAPLTLRAEDGTGDMLQLALGPLYTFATVGPHIIISCSLNGESLPFRAASGSGSTNCQYAWTLRDRGGATLFVTLGKRPTESYNVNVNAGPSCTREQGGVVTVIVRNPGDTVRYAVQSFANTGTMSITKEINGFRASFKNVIVERIYPFVPSDTLQLTGDVFVKQPL